MSEKDKDFVNKIYTGVEELTCRLFYDMPDNNIKLLQECTADISELDLHFVKKMENGKTIDPILQSIITFLNFPLAKNNEDKYKLPDIKNMAVLIPSDYYENAYHKWMDKWAKNDWKNSSGNPVYGAEGWKKIYNLKNFLESELGVNFTILDSNREQRLDHLLGSGLPLTSKIVYHGEEDDIFSLPPDTTHIPYSVEAPPERTRKACYIDQSPEKQSLTSKRKPSLKSLKTTKKKVSKTVVKSKVSKTKTKGKSVTKKNPKSSKGITDLS